MPILRFQPVHNRPSERSILSPFKDSKSKSKSIVVRRKTPAATTTPLPSTALITRSVTVGPDLAVQLRCRRERAVRLEASSATTVSSGRRGQLTLHLNFPVPDFAVLVAGPDRVPWRGICDSGAASIRRITATPARALVFCADESERTSQERRKNWKNSPTWGNTVNVKMAVSAVAKPVHYKLDSAPNPMPLDTGLGAFSSSTHTGVDFLSPNVTRNGRLIVIGHRGCGKNNPLTIGDIPDTRLSVRENTVRSFNLAASNGADNIEFDVQVTKDGHPVIFHDDLLLSEGQAYRIKHLTLEEFLAFGPQKDGKAGKNLVRRHRDGSIKAWSSTLEDSMCTLKDVFEKVDPSVGFNIELKFHDSEVTSESELRHNIAATLADVKNYGKGRSIFFSSFHPDGAIILRQEQDIHPVFFLTDGGENIYVDPRRNSIEAAVDLCIKNGLQGVVTEVLAILKKPELASLVKSAGLTLFTYGDMNNVAEALVQQYTVNVDGVIVDCVREIVTASRTIHSLLNFVQPDWSQFLHPAAIKREIKAQ